LFLFLELECKECILSTRCASTEFRFDSEKLKRDNRNIRPNVVRIAQGQGLTKCREIKTTKHKECVVRFLLKKSLSPNFVKDSRITRSASEVEILRGIKLRRDIDKDSVEREKSIEDRELMVEIPSEEVGVTDSRYIWESCLEVSLGVLR
jgi:hypothetical protein